MHFTGIDPFTQQQVYVAKGLRDRKLRRAMMQFFKPENWFTVRESLIQAGRQDLIGNCCDCLIPAQPPWKAIEAHRRRGNDAYDHHSVAKTRRRQAGVSHLCSASQGTAIMSTSKQKQSTFRFLTSFALPALLNFLVPILPFVFFRHAPGQFDAWMRESIVKQIRSDPKLTKEQRERTILKVSCQRQGKHVQSLKMSKFAQEQEVLDAIQYYYGRYLAAAVYQKQKKQEAGFGDLVDRRS